ncbi:hypothetical protein QQF64_016565 [Cirrhinus molitorella]|uniref:Integrase catalytic domain-containing protein n=1 Tax=Cirrhinus molitorella TaxID=172907 RepID=A0ABR3LQP8_9TELE
MHDIQHITSSPHNPQGNGHAEKAVQTAKRILKQDDPVLALMCFRATPTSSTGVSLAELLMGRKIRTTLPTLPTNLKPKWPNKSSIKERDKAAKEKQAYYFNRRYGVKDLPVLKPGDSVLLKLDDEAKWKGPGTVLAESVTPRSYTVFSETEGEKRRNRRHLQLLPEGVTGVTERNEESSEQSSQKVQPHVDTNLPAEDNVELKEHSGIPKPALSRPSVSELIPLYTTVGIVVLCIWATYTTAVVSPEVAVDAVEPPEVAVLTAVAAEVMVPAAVLPEVVAYAVEPHEMGMSASALCVVVAPSDTLPVCELFARPVPAIETVYELSPDPQSDIETVTAPAPSESPWWAPAPPWQSSASPVLPAPPWLSALSALPWLSAPPWHLTLPALPPSQFNFNLDFMGT